MVDLLTLNAPPRLTSQEILTLHHFDTNLGIGNAPILCPVWRVYSWNNLHHRLDPASINPIASGQFIAIELLRLYHNCACTTGFVISCSYVSGLCRTGKWSHDLGVLSDLKLTWAMLA